MSLEIKEEISAVIFYKDVGSLDAKESVDVAPVFQAVPSAISPDSVNVDIEGIHSIVTRNFTYYSPECLKNSVPYWTSPYEKPVIMHHKDKDGVQIGRIKNVEYLEKTRPGIPGLLFTVNIGDEAGIKGVKNGTLSTVSIGAIVHKATCSICGQNIAAEGECEHKRGKYYDDKLCYWIMDEMEPKELSYVIVPSDKYANTVKIYNPHKKAMKESYSEGDANEAMNIFDNLDLSMAEPEVKPEVQESANEEVQEAADVAEPEIKEEPKAEEKEPQAEEEKPEEKQEEVEEKKEEEQEDKSKEELLDLVKKQEKLIAELKDDIKYLKGKLDKERSIKESLEVEILQFKQANKMHLAEQICDLRKELGLREESMDDLMMLSEESLNSSIKTFMEFKESNTFNVNKLPKIDSAALVSEEQDNTSKEVTESLNNKNNSNIDYEEDIDDWFKKMTHRKYFN
jgi:hypothetical protein